MVSEVVMYQSMFVLGILVFGFFSLTFNNYSDLAEEITIEDNLERIVQKVGKEIINLIEMSRKQQMGPGVMSSTITFNLESAYAGEAYQLQFEQNIQGMADLVAISGVDNIEQSRFSLGYLMGPSFTNGEIDFTGTLFSGDQVPRVTYTWNSGLSIEAVNFN